VVLGRWRRLLILNRGSDRIPTKGKAILREVVINIIYSKEATSKSYGIVKNKAFQH
jgi:hypothetical protein